MFLCAFLNQECRDPRFLINTRFIFTQNGFKELENKTDKFRPHYYYRDFMKVDKLVKNVKFSFSGR